MNGLQLRGDVTVLEPLSMWQTLIRVSASKTLNLRREEEFRQHGVCSIGNLRAPELWFVLQSSNVAGLVDKYLMILRLLLSDLVQPWITACETPHLALVGLTTVQCPVALCLGALESGPPPIVPPNPTCVWGDKTVCPRPLTLCLLTSSQRGGDGIGGPHSFAHSIFGNTHNPQRFKDAPTYG